MSRRTGEESLVIFISNNDSGLGYAAQKIITKIRYAFLVVMNIGR